MTTDAIAGEPQFLDHLAPTWLALPDSVRGRFLVPHELVPQARALGIEVVPTAFIADSDAYGAPEPKGPKALVAAYGDMKKGRRLGYGDFARFEHGIGQSYGTSHPSYAGGLDATDVSLFLMPNAYSARLWQTVYPAAQVEIVGSPRLDSLPAREPRAGPVVALSFHWVCEVSQFTMPAVWHYRDALPVIAGRFTVLGHAHPRFLETMRVYYRRAGIELVESFDEVCRRADVYVADNTSTMYEFAATGRPVVTLNAPHYDRNDHPGLRFWEAADVGVQCDEPGELPSAIELALADAPAQREAREAALAIVYAYRSGAARRAAQRLAAWAREPQMAVA